MARVGTETLVVAIVGQQIVRRGEHQARTRREHNRGSQPHDQEYRTSSHAFGLHFVAGPKVSAAAAKKLRLRPFPFSKFPTSIVWASKGFAVASCVGVNSEIVKGCAIHRLPL